MDTDIPPVLSCRHKGWVSLSLRCKVKHHPRRHLAAREPLEHGVDCRQRLQLDVGLDLAVRGKGQGLGHVAPVADKGAPEPGFP